MCAVQVLPPDSGAPPAKSIRPFAINAAKEGETYVIRLEGELDFGRCPRLERALELAEESRAGRILIDVEELGYIDAAGLHALHRACRRSASNGDRLRITRGKGNVANMFGLTALNLTLPFAPPAATPPTGSTR